MPTSLQAALLGVVQGLTEFLPVSSSAHLILARAFFNFDASEFGLTFDVAVHVGTLLAVVVYFRREVGSLLSAAARMVGARFRPPATPDPAVRLVWLLVIGSIPVAVVGSALGDLIEAELRSPSVAAATLALGAVGFFLAERTAEKRRSESSLTMGEAWWIGCAQTLALVPGVSRSGATMTVAMLFGLARPEAARFVFLLGVPAILGAAAKKGWDLGRGSIEPEGALLFFLGVATSAVVGYLTIRFFIRYLANHSLHAFGWYRLVLAGSVVLWLWGRG